MNNFEMYNIIGNQSDSIKNQNNFSNNFDDIPFENNCDKKQFENIEEILYQDEIIELTWNYLKIFKYYYPFNKDKIIKLSKIKKFSLKKLSSVNGKYRFIGLTWDLTWYHFDKKRPQKEFGIKINDGSIIKIMITPDNPQEVFDLLTEIIKKEN